MSRNGAATLDLIAVALTLSQGATALAMDDHRFFDRGIDYWGVQKQEKPIPETTPDQGKPPAGPAETANGPGFSWDKYLDPKNKEFFREGDYTPPEPFMEIVRNPSDQNLKLWFAYIDKKNELADRLQERMKEFLGKKGITPEPGIQERVPPKKVAAGSLDPKRYRFRMYFESHCPHCRKMMATLAELQSDGFFVEARQVDSDPRGLEGLPVPAERAAAGEIQKKEIQSVPVLLIGDLKKKLVYRLSGYQSTQAVFQTLVERGGDDAK